MFYPELTESPAEEKNCILTVSGICKIFFSYTALSYLLERSLDGPFSPHAKNIYSGSYNTCLDSLCFAIILAVLSDLL